MILRSLAVIAWRCFVEPAAVGPFGEGLNVLFAPNGTGKSTLFEALLRGLLDSHRASGREVEALRPWGRALSPRVTVEFSHDGVEYRISKQFLDGAFSKLERKENGSFRPIAERDDADQQVRALLTQNPPARGLAQARNWGLAQVLWAPQGSLALEGLTEDLAGNIRAALGAQVAGPGSGPLEAKIKELYLSYFTPSGKLRSGRGAPRLVALTGQLEEAKERLRRARELELAFEETSRRVEHLRALRAQARRDCDAIAQALRKARENLAAYTALKAEAERRKERAQAAEARYQSLARQVDLVAKTEKEIQDAERRVVALEKGLPLVERERESLERQAAAARAAVEDARKGRERVTKAEEEAAAARKYVDLRRESETLEKTLAAIEGAERVLAERRKARDALVAPRPEDLKALRRLVREREETRLKIDASLITLEVVAEKSLALEVVAGEETGKRKLARGKPERIAGSPEVVVDIPGVARLRAWGPTGSVAEHRLALARAGEEISRRTAPFGTETLDEIEALAEKARALDGEVAQAKARLEALVGGSDRSALAKERAAREAEMRKLRAEHPEWVKSPPDADALAERAGRLRRDFVALIEAKESEWTKTQAAYSATSGRAQASRSELEASRRHLASVRAQLAELTSDGKDHNQRSAELRELLMTWEAAREGLREVEEDLERFADDPAAESEKLERQLEAAGGQAERALEGERTEQGKLEQILAQAPYAALAAAEEEVSDLDRAIAAERIKVEAAKLLYDTLSEVKAAALSSISEPVELAATRTFHRIAGGRLGRIRIDEAFQPRGVNPEPTPDVVDLADLSGGETEQLYLATRLALAEVLARDERQLVVLDDVLTATDAGRLARVMGVLEDAASRLQILVLTCDPESYRSLANAQFFDLEEAVRAGRAFRAP